MWRLVPKLGRIASLPPGEGGVYSRRVRAWQTGDPRITTAFPQPDSALPLTPRPHPAGRPATLSRPGRGERGKQPLLLLILLLLTLAAPRSANAQILHADWIDEGQKNIAQFRQCGVRIVVLDHEGKPVPSALVHISLQQLSFPLGVPAAALPPPSAQPSPAAPFWRCINAVSLDSLTDWAHLQPNAAAPLNLQPVQAAMAAAEARGQTVRWGSVVNGDPGRLPNWVVDLHDQPLTYTIDRYLDQVFQPCGACGGQFDIYAGSLDHTFVEDRLGLDGLRDMVEHARIAARGATLCLRFEDAFDSQRLQQMIRRFAALRDAFINVDMIAMEGRFGGYVVQNQLARSLQWLHDLDVPVVVVDLEVGGPSPAAAAINAEMILRTLYADSNVKGIYFKGLHADDFTDPNAALIDQDGKPTPVGNIVDGLFHGLWGFDASLITDSLGETRCRVPPGVYQVTAKRFGGPSASGAFLVTGSEKERLLILQAKK